jgi:hypothetical protein
MVVEIAGVEEVVVWHWLAFQVRQSLIANKNVLLDLPVLGADYPIGTAFSSTFPEEAEAKTLPDSSLHAADLRQGCGRSAES